MKYPRPPEQKCGKGWGVDLWYTGAEWCEYPQPATSRAIFTPTQVWETHHSHDVEASRSRNKLDPRRCRRMHEAARLGLGRRLGWLNLLLEDARDFDVCRNCGKNLILVGRVANLSRGLDMIIKIGHALFFDRRGCRLPRLSVHTTAPARLEVASTAFIRGGLKILLCGRDLGSEGECDDSVRHE